MTQTHGGVYPRGSLLPNEDGLAEELGVNRATVNKALNILTSEGCCGSTWVSGTRVHELPPILRDAAIRHSRAHRERGGVRGSLASELDQLGYTLDSANIFAVGLYGWQVPKRMGCSRC
ncbi:GntR family transcriptional regulator [Nonomuraea sp. NPDC003754]